MDYEREIERLTLLLDAERISKKRIQKMLEKAEHDRDRHKLRLDLIQEEKEELSGII